MDTLDGLFAFDHLFPPGGRPDQPSLEAFAAGTPVVGFRRGGLPDPVQVDGGPTHHASPW